MAEYDLASGVKLGSTESPDPILALQYTSDATTLIGISRVGSCFSAIPDDLSSHHEHAEKLYHTKPEELQ